MNDIFEQINKDFKEFIEKRERELKSMRSKTPADFKEYSILFNGTEETYYISYDVKTFDEAQEIIKKNGRNPLTISKLFERDNNGEFRWELIRGTGFDHWCWVEEIDCCNAYIVNLNTGSVYLEDIRNNNYALCE